MGQGESFVGDTGPPSILEERSLSAVASHIKSGDVRRIVVMTGAGISTAAGIPDFRSPETGLYANLARLNLPHAEAVFDISYFRQNPRPFYVLAKELYPGKFSPTVSHAFISLLASKGLLHMLFTQNIDCLERAAGVPSDKIIEAHGSFATQRCIECKTPFEDDLMREHVERGEVPACVADNCNGPVKPDIVFFGEPLPSAFEKNTSAAVEADLILVIGTSLSVYPFAALPELANRTTPRVLFNMERVGQMGSRPDDVLELGPCDAGIRKLADELGWRDELEKLWRDIVGEKEAMRQLSLRDESGEQLEEADAEILKAMTEGIEGIHLRDEEEEGSTKVVGGPVLKGSRKEGISDSFANLGLQSFLENHAQRKKEEIDARANQMSGDDTITWHGSQPRSSSVKETPTAVEDKPADENADPRVNKPVGGDASPVANTGEKGGVAEDNKPQV